jgi:5-bromo-4-chloroindolyl phosphate hydrolysis protein
MSEKVFERSLIALSIVALLWMLLGGIFGILGLAWVIIIGLVVWIGGGGALLYFWGKNYMSRV